MGDAPAFPTDANSKAWTFDNALRAVIGQVNAAGGDASPTLAQILAHDLFVGTTPPTEKQAFSYHAFSKYYYGADFTEKTVTEWQQAVDAIGQAVALLESGEGLELSRNSMTTLTDAIEKAQFFLYEYGEAFGSWSKDLDDDDKGIAGDAADVIQQRLASQQKWLHGLYEQMTDQHNVSMIFAMRQLVNGLNTFIHSMSTTWHAVEADLRNLISNQRDFYNQYLWNFLVDEGLVKGQPGYALDAEYYNVLDNHMTFFSYDWDGVARDLETFIGGRLDQFPLGSLRDPTIWATINQNIRSYSNTWLDNRLHGPARTAIAALQHDYAYWGRYIAALTKPDGVTTAGGPPPNVGGPPPPPPPDLKNGPPPPPPPNLKNVPPPPPPGVNDHLPPPPGAHDRGDVPPPPGAHDLGDVPPPPDLGHVPPPPGAHDLGDVPPPGAHDLGEVPPPPGGADLPPFIPLPPIGRRGAPGGGPGPNGAANNGLSLPDFDEPGAHGLPGVPGLPPGDGGSATLPAGLANSGLDLSSLSGSGAPGGAPAPGSIEGGGIAGPNGLAADGVGAGLNGGSPTGAGSGAPGAAGSPGDGSNGVPFFPPAAGGAGGGGMGDKPKERERQTWLSEDESIWGIEEDAAMGVIGRPDAAGTDEEEPVVPARPTRPAPRRPAPKPTPAETGSGTGATAGSN
jgi:hypothetical protein